MQSFVVAISMTMMLAMMTSTNNNVLAFAPINSISLKPSKNTKLMAAPNFWSTMGLVEGTVTQITINHTRILSITTIQQRKHTKQNTNNTNTNTITHLT